MRQALRRLARDPADMNTHALSTDYRPPVTADDRMIEDLADLVERGRHAPDAQTPDGPDHGLYLGAVAHALARRGHTVAITVTPRTGGIVEHSVRIVEQTSASRAA
jgi:hypothetical protein